MLQPLSFPQATALARLQEDKINDRRKGSQQTLFSVPPQHHAQSFSPTNFPKPKTQFAQRIAKDMAFRRQKGLCYNCDEKWSSSHRCKGRVLLFVAESDEPLGSEPTQSFSTPIESSSDPHPPDLSPINPHISLNALAGIPVTDTFRVYDFINQASLIVLVDSGSTHNFVQPQDAKFLNLPVVDIPPLRVMVGNGLVLE